MPLTTSIRMFEDVPPELIGIAKATREKYLGLDELRIQREVRDALNRSRTPLVMRVIMPLCWRLRSLTRLSLHRGPSWAQSQSQWWPERAVHASAKLVESRTEIDNQRSASVLEPPCRVIPHGRESPSGPPFENTIA